MNNNKIEISIIVPAFNEAKRLPMFLDMLIAYCNKSDKNYEIIVVDDGSSDNTHEVAEAHRDQFHDLETMKIRENRGKGYAVKRGFFRARGQICVFLDADGSVGPEEIERNLHYITNDGYDIFVGSRVLRSEGRSLEALWYRKFIGKIFNFFVRAFLFKNIKDTQCGFKMIKKEIVRPLFSRSYLRGFGFDIEILYLAFKMGYKVKEGAVSWHHVAGSRVNLVTDSVKMFFNVLQIRNWHCTPVNPLGKYLGPDEYAYMHELEDYHWWFVARRNLAVCLIKSLKIPSPIILDIGTGTGSNLLSFSKLGETHGVDIASQAIEFCRKRGIKNVTQCSAEKMTYANKTFDVIACLDLLEHIPEPVEALLEMRRVLKDNGRIIIMVPAHKILWSQHDEALCHLRRYEKDSLLRDLKDAGLKAQDLGYFFCLSFFVVALIRIVRRFFISKGKPHSDTTTLPPKLLNEFLKFLFNIEIKITTKLGLPIGTTIYAVVSKGSTK